MDQLIDTWQITTVSIYILSMQLTNRPLALSDGATQHALGMFLKAMGRFDYEFTVADTENGEVHRYIQRLGAG